MQRTTYTPEQRQQALRLLAEVGQSEAARITGIPSGTIASWGTRHGVEQPPSVRAATAAAAARVRLSVVERKAELAEQMLDDARTVLAQLHQPVVERVVKVVSDGKDAGSHAEIVDVHLERPTPADQERIARTVATLVDKVQLLTGEATSRVEQTIGAAPERTPEQEAEMARVLQLVQPAA
jgi:transposase-like protein